MKPSNLPFGSGSTLNQEMDRWFWSMFRFVRVPFRIPSLDPQPFHASQNQTPGK